MRRLLLVIILVALAVSAASAAVPRPRPYAGVGVLAPSTLLFSYSAARVKEAGEGALAAKVPWRDPLPQEEGKAAQRAPFSLYLEPGVGRIAELDQAALPRLAGTGSEPLFSVSGRKGAWSRVAYDEAGREAWTDPGRGWRYLLWEDFLPGRLVRVLAGMKPVLYETRGEPREEAAAAGTLNRDQEVRVLSVEGDWARIEGVPGWFRWRDGDGRLTVSPR